MKTKRWMVAVLGISTLAALTSRAEVGIGVQINVPVPVVTVPAPVVTVQTVPDSYVWDGTEYVGMIGSQYYYLGPGNVWLALDGPRVARFHDWERGNPDWRAHAIHNTHYRHDAKGHEAPFHDDHVVRDGHDVHDSHGDDHGVDRDHH